MKKLQLLSLCLCLIGLTGCATPKIALEYRPQTTMEIDGNASVGNFGYFPKAGVDQRQIPNTAVGGGIMLTEPVGEFFANAVKQEFRKAGISLKPGGCRLEGEILELLVDDLGFSVDYKSDVRYILYDKTNSLLLDNRYHTNLDKMTKFVVPEVLLQNINKMLSENIKQLFQDTTFIDSMKNSCT